MVGKNERKRRWFITIMNPEAHGLSRDAIIALLTSLSPQYFCFAHELSPTTETLHVHILLCFEHARAFSSLKSKLPTANIQAVRGSVSDCLAYIRKGEQDSESAEKSMFYECGEAPIDRKNSTSTPKSFQILEAIKSGASDLEIMDAIPGAVYQARNLDALRQAVLKEKYGNERREVVTTFIQGVTGSGKTHYVYAQAERDSDICRITNYKRGLLFDDYSASQKIVCLDEFASNFVPIGELLTLTDCYPLQLKSRYVDKVAGFNQVFIISNLLLEEHYRYEQTHQPEVWQALLRRIDKILLFKSDFSHIDITKNYK